MQVFVEVKFPIRILYFLTFFTTLVFVEGAKIRCIKVDECSCKTSEETGPQKEISLWPMPSKGKSHGAANWLYDFNLCHGLEKNADVPDGGCPNSTVCQFSEGNKNETFEIGRFGNATFGQYEEETKSITLVYYGTHQEGATRSITITLQCDEDGNITTAKYGIVNSRPLDPTKFIVTIKAKAACLRPFASYSTSQLVPYSTSQVIPYPTPQITSYRTSQVIPYPTPQITSYPTSQVIPYPTSQVIPKRTSHVISSLTSQAIPYSTTSPVDIYSTSQVIPHPRNDVESVGGGLKTVYIVIITIGGFLLFLAVGCYVAYRRVMKRRRYLLIAEGEDNMRIGV
ncbi:uncharacterized protein LOC114519147 [Dendronephthya gigantea]|uniref:uncharacterized protein LOC114519147 n=1 Tax=Dendronephthya gigantea TaxID=151771 RepID=UPI00106D9F09|nr:uncharacterized protein LOC114519147 [Dendronephthya gigantea]